MIDHELPRLLDQATSTLEPHVDPVSVWRAGRRRHRRTVAAVTAGAVASVAVVVGLAVVVTGSGEGAPEPTPSTERPSTDQTEVEATTVPYLTDEDVAPTLELYRSGGRQSPPEVDPVALAALPWHSSDPAQRSWEPVDPVPLAEDPVDSAVVAVQSGVGEAPGISVLGDDGRWRSLDLGGIELSAGSPDSGNLGIGLRSFSPDGRTLALGQPDGIALVDVTTGERSSLPVDGLGHPDYGREVFWSADGRTVYVAVPGVRERKGFAVDIATGAVSDVPFDPAAAAYLADGTTIEDDWDNDTGRLLRVFDPAGEVLREVVGSSYVVGALDDITALGDRWAARRVTTGWSDDDPRGADEPASGVLVLSGSGVPQRLLPIPEWDSDMAGGSVLGWLDEDTVVFAMADRWEFDGLPHGLHVLAWDTTTDTVTRVAERPDHWWSPGVALVPPE